jgi:hypothetical protein
MTPDPSPRSKWVAIITGAISILVAVLYLGLILVLDSRGPLQPPPPEALGFGSVGASRPAASLTPRAWGATAAPAAAGVPPHA